MYRGARFVSLNNFIEYNGFHKIYEKITSKRMQKQFIKFNEVNK